MKLKERLNELKALASMDELKDLASSAIYDCLESAKLVAKSLGRTLKHSLRVARRTLRGLTTQFNRMTWLRSVTYHRGRMEKIIDELAKRKP